MLSSTVLLFLSLYLTLIVWASPLRSTLTSQYDRSLVVRAGNPKPKPKNGGHSGSGSGGGESSRSGGGHGQGQGHGHGHGSGQGSSQGTGLPPNVRPGHPPDSAKPGEPELIGYHGTNSESAAFWLKTGHIAKPPTKQGALEWLGFGGSKTGGAATARAFLGPGLYVTDNPATAAAYAGGNKALNKGTSAVVCKIYAKTSNYWRHEVKKVWLPNELQRDHGCKKSKELQEESRKDYLTIFAHIPKDQIGSVVRVAELDTSPKKHDDQLLLPDSITANFHVECFDNTLAIDIQRSFKYSDSGLQREWNVINPTTNSHGSGSGSSSRSSSPGPSTGKGKGKGKK